MSSRLIMIYMAGDNNLDSGLVEESHCLRDIIKLQQINFPSDMHCIVQVDRKKQYLEDEQTWSSTRRYEIVASPGSIMVSSTLLADLGETNTGDPKELVKFVTWSLDRYHPERAGLVIWGHGSGWKDYPYDRGAGAAKNGLFNYYFLQQDQQVARVFSEIELTNAELTKMIASDDEARDCLDAYELELALGEVLSVTGLKRLDYLGFDACSMMEFELLYSLRNYADVIIGSQETEPSDGWPYDKIFNRYAAAPDATGADVGMWAVKAYLDYYRDSNKAITLSGVFASKLQLLAESLDKVAELLLLSLGRYYRIIDDTQKFSLQFKEKDFYDLSDFLRSLRKCITDVELSTRIDNCLDALRQCVPYFGALGDGIQNSGGISIYFPRKISNRVTWKIYETLKFHNDFPNWHKFVLSYMNYRPGISGPV
jgi:hypothetical protein